jgi:peptide deformylase
VVKQILLLGDTRLYEISTPVELSDLQVLPAIVQDLHDTLCAFRRRYHVGRAIAAPQIDVRKRLLYMDVDEPIVFINPQLEFPDDEMMEVLDDCMCFPQLLVKVMRHTRCIVHYRDLAWDSHTVEFEGDLAELIQHEHDHLDGILATMRSCDNKSFVFKP